MKHFLTFFVVLLFFRNLSSAQNQHNIDSLQNELKKFEVYKKKLGSKATPLTDTLKADILYELVRETWGKFDTGMTFAKQVLSVSEKIEYKKGVGNAYNGFGLIYMATHNYPMALENYQKALKIRTEIGDKSGLGWTYNNMGLMYGAKGDVAESIKSHFNAIKFREEIGEKLNIEASYGKIGNDYAGIGNFPEALKNYFQALKIAEEIGTKDAISRSYGGIGNIYLIQGNYAEALKYYKEELRISIQIGLKLVIGNSYFNLGCVYYKQGLDTAAINNLLAALKIDEEIGDKGGIGACHLYLGRIKLSQNKYQEALENEGIALKIYEGSRFQGGIANVYNVIGKVYEKQGNLVGALKYATNGLLFSTKAGARDIMKDSYNLLAGINSEMHNYKAAYDYHVLFQQIKDSIFNDVNATKMKGLEMQYDFDKDKAIQKAQQEKKDAITQQEVQRQRNIRNLTFGGLAVVLLFSLLVYRQRNKIAKEKKRSDQLVVEKEMLIKEIHHRVKNNLEVISSLLELQSEGIVDVKAKAAVTEGQSRVQSIALIHHKLYRTDDVSSIEFKGFATDLYKQVSGVFKKPGTEIEFQIVSNETQISIDNAVPLGLILNELLTNTFKYAIKKERLNTITIQLKLEEKLNTIIYKDNGPGLPADFNIEKSSSLGMKVIQLLTKQLGGTLNFYNDHGSVFEIPFNNNHKN